MGSAIREHLLAWRGRRTAAGKTKKRQTEKQCRAKFVKSFEKTSSRNNGVCVHGRSPVHQQPSGKRYSPCQNQTENIKLLPKSERSRTLRPNLRICVNRQKTQNEGLSRNSKYFQPQRHLLIKWLGNYNRHYRK